MQYVQYAVQKAHWVLIVRGRALCSRRLHDSALASFLLVRALQCPNVIGHLFFWYPPLLPAASNRNQSEFGFHSWIRGFVDRAWAEILMSAWRPSRYLRSEMHVVEIAERFGLLLEYYLEECGYHRKELLKQYVVTDKFIAIAAAAKQVGKSERPAVIQVNPPPPPIPRYRCPVRASPPPFHLSASVSQTQDHLRELELPEVFCLPINPQWECRGLVNEKCRSMSSKKVPLWLVFENAEQGCQPFLTLFKSGDDLRQDLLTLQLLKIMDTIWKSEGMDLKLIPYGCVATGDELGCAPVPVGGYAQGHPSPAH